jgi:soluble lytic murein transglycosylase-like protein
MRPGILALASLVFIVPASAQEAEQRHSTRWQQQDAPELSAQRREPRARSSRRMRVVERAPQVVVRYVDPRSPAAAEPIFGGGAPVLVQRPARERISRRVVVEAPGHAPRRASGGGALDSAIARHAAANGLPVALVHRVVVRESRYNSRAVGRGGAMGLMQIKTATARGMGYRGSANGLLDAETNLTYAVRYLAGAYRAAGGNANRAVAYYASGYHGKGARTLSARRRTATRSEPW